MGDADEEFSRLIQPALAKLQLDLSRGQLSALARHFGLLQRWNRNINLTSVRRPEDIVQRHFGESLFVGTRIPEGAESLVDVGSGAGFPGIPVAVLRPGIDVTLVESVAKKAAFLQEAVRDLDNATVFHGRFEDLKRSFDWATVRGVACERIWGDLRRNVRRLAVVSARHRATDLTSLDGVVSVATESTPWVTDRVVAVCTLES